MNRSCYVKCVMDTDADKNIIKLEEHCNMSTATEDTPHFDDTHKVVETYNSFGKNRGIFESKSCNLRSEKLRLFALNYKVLLEKIKALQSSYEEAEKLVCHDDPTFHNIFTEFGNKVNDLARDVSYDLSPEINDKFSTRVSMGESLKYEPHDSHLLDHCSDIPCDEISEMNINENSESGDFSSAAAHASRSSKLAHSATNADFLKTDFLRNDEMNNEYESSIESNFRPIEVQLNTLSDEFSYLNKSLSKLIYIYGQRNASQLHCDTFNPSNTSRVCRIKNANVEVENIKNSNMALFLQSVNVLEKVVQNLENDFHEWQENYDQSMSDYVSSNFKENIWNVCRMLQSIKEISSSILMEMKAFISNIGESLDNVFGDIQKAVTCVIENVVTSLENRNSDLLKDMQEVNNELKKRGEMISSLNDDLIKCEKQRQVLSAEIEDHAAKLANMESLLEEKNKSVESMSNSMNEQMISAKNELSKLEDIANNLRECIGEKDFIINNLQAEISHMKECQDADTVSMGTLSRTEESARLRDVEDSFEERYNKLRVLALKMKKRILDLSEQLEKEKSSAMAEKEDLKNKITQLTPNAKLCQNLQTECDKLNDLLEGRENEIKGLKKLLVEHENVISALNARISTLTKEFTDYRCEYNTLLENKTSLQAVLESTKIEIKSLTDEKSANEVIRKEKDREIQALKDKLGEKQVYIDRMKTELESMKLELRKQGALNLEIKDYEKTISDLTSQLKSEKKVTNDLNRQMNRMSESNQLMIQQIKHLEESLNTAERMNLEANEHIVDLNRKVVDYKRVVTEKDDEVTQLREQYETKRREKENAISELEKLVFQNTQMSEKYERLEETLTRQVNVLKTELNNNVESVKLKQQELDRVNQDFESYKLKVQNAFQKHKTEKILEINEKRLREEIDVLQKDVECYKNQLMDAQAELNTLKTEHGMVEKEKDRLLKKNEEIIVQLEEKTDELETVNADAKKFKLDVESEIADYKAQLNKLTAYEDEINILKKKLEDANAAKMERKEPEIDSHLSSNGDIFSPVSNTLKKVSHSSVENSVFFNKNAMVPLEELLFATENENYNGKSKSDANSDLKQQLEEYKNKVRYLTGILNESESNVIRNDQLISVLKSEVRRLQNITECQAQIENAEYLKNIFLKFLTLPSGDERSRLVPVLQTILKLTPEESKELMSAAGISQDGWSSWGAFLKWK